MIWIFIHVRYEYSMKDESVRNLNMRARGAVIRQNQPELGIERFKRIASRWSCSASCWSRRASHTAYRSALHAICRKYSCPDAFSPHSLIFQTSKNPPKAGFLLPLILEKRHFRLTAGKAKVPLFPFVYEARITQVFITLIVHHIQKCSYASGRSAALVVCFDLFPFLYCDCFIIYIIS